MITKDQFEELSEQIKRRYSTEEKTIVEPVKAEIDILKKMLNADKLELTKLYKENDDLKTCLKERNAIVPKLEHAMEAVFATSVERDDLRAQNAIFSAEIATLKKRIADASQLYIL